MLSKMTIKLKFTAEINISDNNLWKYCVFWNVNDLRWMAVKFGSKIKFFQANFLKIVFLDDWILFPILVHFLKIVWIWNDLNCWLWLDFPNLPHFLSDFVGIWNDLQCWFLVGIPKSSTHSERFTANCRDLEFLYTFFIDFGWIWNVVTVDFGWNSKIFHNFFR